ncbi:hypothetical protein OE88DRAFT_1732622 [Heliocybe sulcata]|uniref:Peptidase S1 domain-containing protein n=1 Tax=Heliocybe sulcata TaxID=5364 RepID=A0A5C3NBQ0_9AGAM|nr:hypothetical protein OE88DRAFT_1732622 [Heliocybe sulcata]
MISPRSLALTAALVLGAHADVCFTWNGVGVNTLSNFTVDAVNTTLPNANRTGAPLGWSLALGPASANGSWWLTNPAYDPVYSNDDNTLSLADGVLAEAYPAEFKSAPVAPGSALMAANIAQLKSSAPEDSYCVVAPGLFGARPKLAVKGRDDLFSICHYDPGAFGQAVVIFNGTSVPGAYDDVDAACYKVDLYVNHPLLRCSAFASRVFGRYRRDFSNPYQQVTVQRGPDVPSNNSIGPLSLSQLRALGFQEGSEHVFYDWERLAAFYPNAAYDFYGLTSGLLYVFIRAEAPGLCAPVQVPGGSSERLEQYDKGVRWTSIDPVAFAEAGKKTFSLLLLWVGVVPGSVSYELANTAAEAVTKLISEAGFSDFEIGFREKPFTPTLGLAIAPLKTPHYEGTGALYIRENNEGGRIFLLTCTHVARPVSDYRSMGLVHKMSSSPRDHIIALGHFGYASTLRSMTEAIAGEESLIKSWQDMLTRLGEYQEGESEETTMMRKEHLNLMKRAQRKIREIDELHSHITKLWTVAEDRDIGEVIHVEPIASVGPQKFTEDWALVALDESKFEWDKFKGNVVYIGASFSILVPQDEDRIGYVYPDDGLLQARGAIQLDDIYNPKQVDDNGEQCLLVVKNGLATGTSIGRVLGMESYTRVYKEGKIDKTSVEIGVLPYGYKRGPRPFSAPGDSGSIVLDRSGGILGMITGGAGTADDIDVTYVTPYMFLDKAIKRYFPESSLYETVA